MAKAKSKPVPSKPKSAPAKKATAPKQAATLKEHFAKRPAPADKDYVIKNQEWLAHGRWLAVQEGVRFGPS